jgi:hypothetical protein
MASANNSPSQSLVNAALASLVGNPATLAAAAAFLTPVLGSVALMTPLLVDITKAYYSSMIPSVSTTGQSTSRQLLQGPLQVDMKSLAPEFDHDFTDLHDVGKTYMRGNQPYERPCGSYRIALKVKDKFGTDNVWLGMKGSEAGEWPVSYHGTGQHNALNIAEEGYKLSKGKRFLFGKGIYSTPELSVAKLYATKFQHESTSYLCVIQNRVNPKYLMAWALTG